MYTHPVHGTLLSFFKESLNTEAPYLELPEDVLRHVVLGEGVHHEVLVAGGAVAGPVLGALLPPHLPQLRQHHHDRAE